MKLQTTSKTTHFSHALAMAAVAILLTACSGQQAKVADHGMPIRVGGSMDEAAKERFWSQVKPVSNLAQAHYKLGRYYQKRGKHGSAIEEFTKAVEVDPAYVLAYNGMGVSYDALGDCEAAKKAYNQALQVGPNLAYLHNNLGCSRLLCNDPQQALTHFSKAAALDSSIPRIHNNLMLATVRTQELHPEQQGMVAGSAAPVPPVVPPVAEAGQGGVKSVQEVTTTAVKAPAPEGKQPSAEEAAPQQPPAPVAAMVEPEKAVDESPVAPPATDTIVIKPLVEQQKQQDNTATSLAEFERCPVDIANGNGITGMARRSAGFLRGQGVAVGRVVNARHFQVQTSTVYYRAGYRQWAETVASLIPGRQAVLQEANATQAGNGIRLVLGQDLAGVDFSRHVAKKTPAEVTPAIAGVQPMTSND